MRTRPEAIDFHCHLDLYDDHEALIRECDADRIAVLAVTTTPKAFARNVQAARGSDYVRVAAGLHPQLVHERASELPLLLELLASVRYVGEVGLDAGPRYFRSLDAQTEVFGAVLKACARHGGKILTVHTVRTAKRVLDMIETLFPEDRGRAVLHWFSGTPAEARRAVDLGCYFSINEGMLSSEKGRALVAGLPVDRLLTETDGPFLQIEGRSARPRDVTRCVAQLSETLAAPALPTRLNANLKELLAAVGAE